jgi:hypothetical protein
MIMIIISFVNVVVIMFRDDQMSELEKNGINPLNEHLLFRPQKKTKNNVELVVRRFAADIRYSCCLCIVALFTAIKPNVTLIDSLMALVLFWFYCSNQSTVVL